MTSEPVGWIKALEAYYLLHPLDNRPSPGGRFSLLTQLSNEELQAYATKGTKVVANTLGTQETETFNEFFCQIKSPHVHYNGNVYLLKKEEWKALSKKIVEKFRAKLADAQGINYDQLNRLSDIMDEII